MEIVSNLLDGVVATVAVIFISTLVHELLDVKDGSHVWWRILIIFVVVLGIQGMADKLNTEYAEEAEETYQENYEVAYRDGYNDGFETGIIRMKDEFYRDIEDLFFYTPDADDVEGGYFTFEDVAKKIRELDEEVSNLLERFEAFN